MDESEAPATAQPRGPGTRKAARAAALRRLLRVLVDTIPLYLIGALWVNNITIFALVTTRWTSGMASRAAALAKTVNNVAFHAMGLLFPLGAPLFFLKIEWLRKAEADEGRHPESGGARLRQDGYGLGPFPWAVSIAIYASFVMFQVALLLQVFAPAKGSWQEKFGSAIGDMASFVICIVLDFYMFPRMIVQLRATRM